MQASVVQAYMPITTNVPVTLIVLNQPDSIPESLPVNELSVPAARTVPAKHRVKSLLGSNIRTISTKYHAEPKIVNIKSRSLLKNRGKQSLLKSVTLPQVKQSLLTPSAGSISSIKNGVKNLKDDAILIDLTKDELDNKLETNAAIRPPPVRLKVVNIKRRSLLKNGKHSPIKPLIAPDSKHLIDTDTNGLREEANATNSIIGQPTCKMEIICEPSATTVKSRSLLRTGMSGQGKSLIKKGGENLKEHDYVIRSSGNCSTTDQSQSPKPPENAIPGKMAGENSHLQDKNILRRKRKSVSIVYNKLKRAKEKLHSRHRKMSAAVEKVDGLKKLLLNLKSRNLVSSEGHILLDRAVKRAYTFLNNNFPCDSNVPPKDGQSIT